ncbi:hypothetical protein I3760_11G084600 [Carya illinoinensis]|nr:hypothetical protein I3760_11G084600 [Carya illinoinensis]
MYPLVFLGILKADGDGVNPPAWEVDADVQGCGQERGVGIRFSHSSKGDRVWEGLVVHI